MKQVTKVLGRGKVLLHVWRTVSVQFVKLICLQIRFVGIGRLEVVAKHTLAENRGCLIRKWGWR